MRVNTRKLNILIFVMLAMILCGSTSFGQTTTITATVTDSDAQTWNNGVWTLAFKTNGSNPNVSIYNINGSPLNPSVTSQNGTMNGLGVLTASIYQNGAIVPAGSSWDLTVCPNASAKCTFYNFSTGLLTSLDLSSVIDSLIAAPRFQAISGTYGYLDIEATVQLAPGSIYYNVTSGCQRVYNATTAVWACATGGGGGTIVGQANGVIPLATANTVIGAQSPLDVGLTNPSQITSTLPIVLPTTGGFDFPLDHQAASANAAVTSLSVRMFGAKADRILLPVNNCTIPNGSSSMTCSAASFVNADAGKFIGILSDHSVFNASTSPQLGQVAMISTVTDATHIILNKTTVKTTGGLTVEYGTDNVPAHNTCTATAQTLSGNVGTCKIPAGNYLLATAPNYMLWGAYHDGAYGQSAGCVVLPTVTTTISGGQISGYTITNAGSGCTPNAQLQLSLNNPTNQTTSGCGTVPRNNGPCGWAYGLVNTNATGSATSVTNSFPGYGFTSAPTTTVIPLGGDGAAYTATIAAGAINGGTLTATGGGYLPSGTMNVFGVNGTGCAPVNPQTTFLNTPGINITAVGTAIIGADGKVASVSFSNPGSGCSAPPAIIFGDHTCWSGSDFSAQCTNISPLLPTKQPVQVGMAQGVSWEGASATSVPSNPGAELFGVIDFSLADSNQPIMFGGDQYMAKYSINGIGFQNGFVGIASSFTMAAFTMENMLFATSIGVYSAGQDNFVNLHDLQFFGYASQVSGGIFTSRVNGPNVAGGFMANTFPERNISFSGTTWGANHHAVDDFFATTFFHPEYTANAVDFDETCVFPQTPNQIQTSHSIVSPGINGGGNGICYPGITDWAIIDLPKQVPSLNNHFISAVTAVGLSRGGYYGDFGANGILSDLVCCESGQRIGSDPYRANSGTKSGIISYSSGFMARNSVVFASGTVQQVLWEPKGIVGAGYPAGYPTGGWSGLLCLSCTANPTYLINNNNASPGVIENYSAITIAQPSLTGNGGTITSSASQGIQIKSGNGTDALDVRNSGIQFFGGAFMNADQGTGMKVQHSTGLTTSQDCVKFDATGNTADNGSACPVISGTPTVNAGVCWKTASVLGTCTAGTWPNCTTCN